MDIASFLGVFLSYFISTLPALVFWSTVIVLVAVRLRHDGGRAKKFLIIGAAIGIISSLVRIPAGTVSPWLFIEEHSLADIKSVTLVFGLIPNLIGMVGVICLFYAFWIKFNTGKPVPAESASQDLVEAIDL